MAPHLAKWSQTMPHLADTGEDVAKDQPSAAATTDVLRFMEEGLSFDEARKRHAARRWKRMPSACWLSPKIILQMRRRRCSASQVGESWETQMRKLPR